MPVSARKQAANKLNAQKSTGPRTPAGKAISSRNACRHGAASIGILNNLRNENIADLHAIRAAMADQYTPANIQETQLVELISSAYIRLQRAEEMSTALLDATLEAMQRRNGFPVEPTPEDSLGYTAALANKDTARAWQNIERYRTRATLDYHRSVELLNRLQSARREEPVRQGDRELRIEEQRIKTENHRRRSIAVTEHVLTSNEATNQPTTPAFATPLASKGGQAPRPAADAHVRQTPTHTATVQNCDNRRTLQGIILPIK